MFIISDPLVGMSNFVAEYQFDFMRVLPGRKPDSALFQCKCICSATHPEKPDHLDY